MPFLDAELHRRVQDATALANAGELARAELKSGSAAYRELHIARLELLYELALLRMFVQWEVFLEASFLRYLCGYVSRRGSANLRTGVNYALTLSSAELTMLGGQSYVLWHDPNRIVMRAQRFFVNAPHEIVIASQTARLLSFAAIRHRIAHGQNDAKQKFDAATLQLAGRRYRGSRPGRFLRDWDNAATPPRRWLETIAADFIGLAGQIV
jgi:hypothetical protein